MSKLTIDFTTATLDSRITFGRADNTATVVNSGGYVTNINANIPRFDYDPISLVCKGLLIEESRINALSYSEQFEQLTYTKTRVKPFGSGSVVDATTSPANTLTADKLVEDATASNTHQISVSKPFVLGTTYTLSIFAKADTRPAISLGFGTTAFPSTRARFNLTTGIATTEAGTPNAKITKYNNGWYRCSISVAATATATDNVIFYINNGTTVNYSGDGTSGIYIWGAQLETGSFSTSYIPTTLLAVTRNSDVATMTGTNFSAWWQASKGGAQVSASPGTVNGIRPWVQFDDGTANQIIALRGNTTNPELYIVNLGAPQAQIDAGTISANINYNLTGWWATNDCKARLDGNAVVLDTSATIPTVTQARLGSDGTNYLNGHLASINYYNTFSSQIYTRRKNKAVFSLL